MTFAPMVGQRRQDYRPRVTSGKVSISQQGDEKSLTARPRPAR